MNKKKLILIGVSSAFVIAIIITTLSLTLFKSNDNVILSDNDNNKNLINNSLLTLMLEQSDGTYQESTSNTWPSGNYAFNESLSRCENGGELEWDREQGIVKLLSNKSDGCYVYFDLYNVVQITNVQTTKTTNSITLTVTVEAGENPVATYYFSIDGGRGYQESNTNTYTFSNLDYGTTYTIQIYAVDTLGYESNEEVIEVTTDNYVNPVVNSVTATNVENDSITVSVSASAGTNAIQTYHYSINNGAYTSSSSNTYTFSGLNSGTNYSIRVYVTDTTGVESNVYTINAETISCTKYLAVGTKLLSALVTNYPLLDPVYPTYESPTFEREGSYSLNYTTDISINDFISIKESYYTQDIVGNITTYNMNQGYALYEDYLVLETQSASTVGNYSYKLEMNSGYCDLCIDGYDKTIVDCNLENWWKTHDSQ